MLGLTWPEVLVNLEESYFNNKKQETSQYSDVSGPSGIGKDNESRNPLFGQMSGSDESDDEPVIKKRKRFQQIREDDSSEDEAGVGAGIGFLKHAADVGDYVALVYRGSPYMGEVIAVNAVAGYQVKVLENDKTNCFKWSDEKEPIWYRNISFVVDHPCPANNRGAWKFSDSDFEKFKCLP